MGLRDRKRSGRAMSTHFNKVLASDISKQQIENAFQAANIEYTVCSAEQTPFEDQSFNLITVGQALHWFDLDAFYAEAKRTLKEDGLLAVWGYANLSISDEIDKHFLHFYNNVVGPYWDEARRLVEDEYRNIHFPFKEISTPNFSIEVDWNVDQLAGYLTSWSATQKFIKANQYNPVGNFMIVLKPLWKKDEVKRVKFPVFLRLGKV